MRVICDRAELLSALTTASHVVARRSLQPVLENVKLVASDAGTTLLATDLDLAIRTEPLGVKVDRPGTALLPTQRTLAILRSATEQEVMIEVDDHLKIRCGSSRFSLTHEPPDLFPDVPEWDDQAACHEIAGCDLARLIRTTVFAADPQAVRFALNGTLVERSAAGLTMVGTDGRRLAVATANYNTSNIENYEPGPSVIPIKALRLIQSVAGATDQPVHLAVSRKSVLVRADRTIVYSRLVDGRYPDWKRTIPGTPAISASIEVGRFVAALEQSLVTVDKVSHRVLFRLSEAGLSLTAVSPDVGSAEIEIPFFYDDDPVEITLDPELLLHALRVLRPDANVCLEITDSRTAVVVRLDDSFIYTLMPFAEEAK